MDDTIKIIESMIDNYYKDTHLIGTEEEESDYLADIEEEDDESNSINTSNL
tara:strand:- start:50 stop:202 length:153 start_codon:yes stop_codon:yes gene_type:complete